MSSGESNISAGSGRSSSSEESQLASGTSAASQESPDKEAAEFDWNRVLQINPSSLQNWKKDELQELFNTFVQNERWDVTDLAEEKIAHVFKMFQALLKNWDKELRTAFRLFASEPARSPRQEQGSKSKDLRGELWQIQEQLELKTSEVTALQKELSREKRNAKELVLRTEEADEEVKKLKRKNEQLQEDVDFLSEMNNNDTCTKENFQKKLSSAHRQLEQCLDDLQRAEDEILELKTQNKELQKSLEESVTEMEKMTEKFDKLKTAVQRSDSKIKELRKERDQATSQVRGLTEKMRRTEEDDVVMATVNTYVEEWKKVLSVKDEETSAYRKMVHNLKEKLRLAQLDLDKSNISALQQALQERDDQIKMLSEQVVQYTREMEQHTQLMEGLKTSTQKDRGRSSAVQQRKVEELKSNLKAAELRVVEAEQAAKLAEAHAEEKDKALIEALKRLSQFVSGNYDLEAAIGEIKECKHQIRARDCEAESLTKEINQLSMKINELVDENEHFRERLGLEPGQEVDLSEFRRARQLRQRQYKAENQVLTKEIDRLEEERLELKIKLRSLAKERGVSTSPSELEEDLKLSSRFTELRRRNEFLEKTVKQKERELNLHKAEFDVRLGELSKVKHELEAALTEVLINSQERSIASRAQQQEEEAASSIKQQLLGAEEQINQLERELKLLRRAGSSEMSPQPLTLPDNLDPSSAEIISSLNEYAVRLLQELNNREEQSSKLATSLEEYRDKLSMIGHQQGLLYREHLSEKADWEKKLKVSMGTQKKLEEQNLQLEQRLTEMEEALAKAEGIITAKEELISDGLSQGGAEESIRDLQEALDKKDHLLKTYDQKLALGIQERENMMRIYQEELRRLQDQLHSQARKSLDLHKQMVKKPVDSSVDAESSTGRLLKEVAALKEAVIERDILLSSITDQLNQANEIQAKRHAEETSRLKEAHAAQVKAVAARTEDQLRCLATLDTKMKELQVELAVEKEANNSMGKLVEEQKRQLARREKQIKGLCKALQELRAEMVATAEKKPPARAVPKKEELDLQNMINKQTRELKAQIKDLTEKLQSATESARAARNQEKTLKEELHRLTSDLQASKQGQKRLQAEQRESEREIQELKQQNSRFKNTLQLSQADKMTIENLQRKVRTLEAQLRSRPGDKERRDGEDGDEKKRQTLRA